MPGAQLSTTDHDRDAAGMRYVYPVVSRRAGGVSIGVNLNVNNACNWRCIYCQVPNLSRGGPPPVDLALLERELRAMLDDVLHGGFMATSVPEDMRRLNDIALSGNGEPTTAREFPAVVELIGGLLREYGLAGRVKPVLISNGSQVDRPSVRAGLARLGELGGEAWFKLDRASAAGLRAVNGTATTPERVMRRLAACAALCPTWIQTCVFALDGLPPPETELVAYLDFLGLARAAGIPLLGVLLYGIARDSTQPEADRLGKLTGPWIGALADRIEAIGLTCRTYP